MSGLWKLAFLSTLLFILQSVIPSRGDLAESASLGYKVTTTLDQILNGYDKRVRPQLGGVWGNYSLTDFDDIFKQNEPVTVGITMYILAIPSISDSKMDYTVDFYFRQLWKDERLAFKGLDALDNIILFNEEVSKRIWKPDTFFANAKTSFKHTVTEPNELLRLTSDGSLLFSRRYSGTFSCPMDFSHYPMDTQLCTMEIESYGFTMRDVRYDFAKGDASVGIAQEVSLPGFKVLGYRQKEIEINLMTGNYSRLAVEIQFERSLGYHVVRTYLPSAFLVILSICLYWITPVDQYRLRITLSFATVLVLLLFTAYVTKDLPQISYVKAIDIWLGACVVFSFITFLHACTLSFLGCYPNSSTEAEAVKTPAVDYGMRIVIPLLFILFNVIYWAFYLNTAGVVSDLIPL